ncbi:MAG: OmpH family outer membrane protein [Bacteroidia bacterium]
MMRLVYLIIVSIILSSCHSDEKVGYVDINLIFNDFEYKKQLENELTSIKEKRIAVLDSLELELKLLYAKLGDRKDSSIIGEFERSKSRFLSLKESYERKTSEDTDRFDKLIVKQLNQYVKEFGEVEKYKIIYGTSGNGNIMYADSTLNITHAVTAFINQKYKGN